MELPGLKATRLRRMLTQVELGEKAGIGAATINRIENARHLARISTVRKLAAALGVEPRELTEPAERAP